MVSTESLGKRIYLDRQEKGLSPEAYGAKVGITGQTIRRLEDGRQKSKTLRARTRCLLAREMGQSVQELFQL